MEKCHFLYEKGKIKNEVNRIMFKKNSELRLKKELDECTFAPKINQNYKIVTDGRYFQGMFEKAVQWSARRIERIMKEKKIKASEMDNYAYRPKVR